MVENSIYKISSINQIVEARLDAIRDQVANRKDQIGDAEIYTVGALKTGLYIGPKPGYLSFNSECHFSQVIEADIRIVLGSDKDPHNPVLINEFVRILHPDFEPKRREVHHWSNVVPTTHFYRYDKEMA